MRGWPAGEDTTSLWDANMVSSYKDSDGISHRANAGSGDGRYPQSRDTHRVSIGVDKAEYGYSGDAERWRQEAVDTSKEGFDIYLACSYVVDVHSRDVRAEMAGQVPIGQCKNERKVVCFLFSIGRDVHREVRMAYVGYERMLSILWRCEALSHRHKPV